jgi:hypothetical protein
VGGANWRPLCGPGVSGRTTARFGAGASERETRQEPGRPRLDGFGHEGQDARVTCRRGQRATREDAAPAADRAGAPGGGAPTPCGLSRRCRASSRAMRATFRDPVPTGAHGHSHLRPWKTIRSAQVVKRSEPQRVVDVEHRIIAGTPARRNAPTLRARGRRDQHGRHRAAQHDMPGTLGVVDAPQSGAGALYADPAAWDVSYRHGLYLLYPACASGLRRWCEDAGHDGRHH